jgi:hypothetical protein
MAHLPLTSSILIHSEMTFKRWYSRRVSDRPHDFNGTHHLQEVLRPRRQRLRKLPRRLLHQLKQRQTARQRKPTSIRSHRQSPAMNATTVSLLGLRRRQRAQDLLREAPRKALRRAPASQCACASQSAIRIAAIASVHVNCTAQSRVTLIHCIAHQLLVNLVAGAVLAMFAPPSQGGRWPECQNRTPHTVQWADNR